MPFDWAANSKNEYLTVNNATEDRGANYNYTHNFSEFNDGMVSPYVYFDGDFTFEWEYKPTDVSFDWEVGSTLEIRTNKYSEPIIKFGVQFGYDWEGDVTGEKLRFIADLRDPDNHGWHQTSYYNKNSGDAATAAMYNNVFSFGVKFRVTRTINEGKASYVYTVIPYTDANKTEGQKIEWTFIDITEENYGPGWDDAAKTVQVLWHNYRAAGEYSNIRWAHTATPDWDAPVVD